MSTSCTVDPDVNHIGSWPARFADVRRLGEGAEGGTFVASDREGGGRRVVLKWIPDAQAGVRARTLAFLRRAGSPHLPAVVGLVPGQGGSWLVTAFVDGTPLGEGPVAPSQVISEGRAIAQALATIHEAGTHHGDVSPANVIATPTRGLVLTDLGHLGQRGSGTPGFLAPEVLGGGGGPSADVFALGSLLCVRLYGRVPWRRPESLARLRTARDVERVLRSLSEYAVARVPRELETLLEVMLDPDPSVRPPHAGAVHERLCRLDSSLRPELSGGPKLLLPTRWPYRGRELSPLLGRLATSPPQRPRLVAVAGPKGAGRQRFIEEIILGLEAEVAAGRASAPARLLHADRVEPLLGRTGTWLSAVAEAKPGPEGPEVIGLVGALSWPASLGSEAGLAETRSAEDEDATAVVEVRAAVLQAAVLLASHTFIVSVSVALGQALRRLHDPSLVVVEPAPWSEAVVAEVVAEVVPPGVDGRGFARALRVATGGWPGRTLTTLEACDATGAVSSEVSVVSAVAAEAMHVGAPLGFLRARAVLERAWREELEPSCDAEAVSGELWAKARRELGDELPRQALAHVERRRAQGRGIGLLVAVDAACPKAVAEALAGREIPESSELAFGPFVAFVTGERGASLPPAMLARIAARFLAAGDPTRALQVAEGALTGRGLRRGGGPPEADTTDLEVVLARSLQQVGRPADALVVLGYPASSAGGNAGPDEGTRLAVVVRSLVDLGRVGEALVLARRSLDGADQNPAADLSQARLLAAGAYAAAAFGEADLAERWLHASERCLPATDAPEVLSQRARTRQLAANLVLVAGRVREARAFYEEAAACFARAGEALGGLWLAASIASVCVLSGEPAVGAEQGRIAFAGLLARGQLQALPGIALNVVQHLMRQGRRSEASRLCEVVGRILEARPQLGPLAAARHQRAEAEVARGAVLEGASALEVAARFESAAIALEGAGATHEAIEAWLQASALFRRGAQDSAAFGAFRRAEALHLAANPPARLAGSRTEDPGTEDSGIADPGIEDPALRLEALELATRFASDADVRVALRRVAELPEVAVFAEQGRRDLAWTRARGVCLALLRMLPSGHPAVRRAVRTARIVLEDLMKQVHPVDRKEARAVLLSEGDETQLLDALLSGEGDSDRSSDRRLLGPTTETGPGRPRDPGLRETGVARPTTPREAHPREVDGGFTVESLPAPGIPERLLRIYRRIAREDDLPRVLEQVVDAMMELSGAERGVVVVRSSRGDASDRLEVARELLSESAGVDFSRSVIERVLTTAEPVLSVDAAHDDRFDASRSISHLNLRSVLAVPLVFRGEVLGAAYVDHRLRRGHFDDSHLQVIEEFASLAALAVAHARVLGEVRRQARELEAQKADLASLLAAREAEVRGLRDEARKTHPKGRSDHGMVGNSASMQRVYHLVDRLADADAPVVIYGESGTGKELVARAIHRAGRRRDRPFVAENCAAIPESLLESVLFGHAKGAFTGAVGAKIGLFEAAEGGTIFLDEIGEMSLNMQSKLLRVLQDGIVRRVGDHVGRKVEVRVIAASNKRLEAMVAARTFREDLYYRINVVKLELPPLRERSDDIPALVAHFLARYDAAKRLEVAPATLRVLSAYPFPGNVRELENEVQRWSALVDRVVTPDDLSPPVRGRSDVSKALDPSDLRIRPRVERMERELIERALEATGHNQTKAAERLGLSRFGLQKKLKRYEEGAAGETDGDDPSDT